MTEKRDEPLTVKDFLELLKDAPEEATVEVLLLDTESYEWAEITGLSVEKRKRDGKVFAVVQLRGQTA